MSQSIDYAKNDDVLDLIRNAVGADAFIAGDQINQATSYWDSSDTIAKALVKPKSTADVSGFLQICNQHDQPIALQGGLTNAVMSAESSGDEVILSLKNFNKIEEVDLKGGTVTVGAGVVLQTLQEHCADLGFLFPLDLGSRGSCTIGGNAATNAGGINVLRYGMARNLILGMEVVLADGTILSSMNQMLKNNAGYDLKQLFIGSEGTLGVITRLVLRLFPMPKSCNSALLALDNFDDVISLLNNARTELGGDLSAFEVMWGSYYQGVTGGNGHNSPISRDYSYYVMVEARGGDIASDKQRFDDFVERGYLSRGVVDGVVPRSEAERASLWAIREDFESIYLAGPIFLYDVSLPIVNMQEYVEKVEKALLDQWPDSVCYSMGHIADGNIHFFIRANAQGTELQNQSDEIVYRELRAFNGSVSAEHGVGRDKIEWLPYCRTDTELALMKTLKKTLDPKNILNRARVVDAEI